MKKTSLPKIPKLPKINIKCFHVDDLVKGVRSLATLRPRQRHHAQSTSDSDRNSIVSITLSDTTSIYDSKSSVTSSPIPYEYVTPDSASSISTLCLSRRQSCFSIVEQTAEPIENRLTSELIQRTKEVSTFLEDIATAKRIIQSKKLEYGVRQTRQNKVDSSKSEPATKFSSNNVDSPLSLRKQSRSSIILPEAVGSHLIVSISVQSYHRVKPGLYAYLLHVVKVGEHITVVTKTSEDFYQFYLDLVEEFNGEYEIPPLPIPMTVGQENSWKRKCLLGVILKQYRCDFERFCSDIIKMPAIVSRNYKVTDFFMN
ncbi:hypothetical protein BKA69DRAFT_1142655 [Paraphysoderma sedebokerense]|nr:hypothetical protein BKA69DRAFT_1142655 [Paraphysoderma sedebokerense]